jgi:hypothetical protein
MSLPLSCTSISASRSAFSAMTDANRRSSFPRWVGLICPYGPDENASCAANTPHRHLLDRSAESMPTVDQETDRTSLDPVAACRINFFSPDRVAKLGVPLVRYLHNFPHSDQMYFVAPPQDSTVVPVMYEFFSDTRNAAIHPISSGSAKRFSNDIPASVFRT